MDVIGRRWTALRGSYQVSPTGSPAMFQLQEIRGVIRAYGPGPTRPVRSTGSAATP